MSLQSFVWYIFGAINTWSRLPIFEVPPDPLVNLISNAILFERLSFLYPLNFTNNVAVFERQKNLGRLSACASISNTTTRFEWQFNNGDGKDVDLVRTNNCEIIWKAPEQGVYTVTLTAYQNDNPVVRMRQNVRFVDFWIVAIGDSFASGEANPDTPINVTGVDRAGWLSERCHRSKKSWPFKVYEKILHFTRKKFAIHFTYLACSGALIDDGALSIMSQLDVVEAIRKQSGFTPKLLMMSAGGNDVGFSNIINQLMHKRSLSASRINFRLLFVAHQFDRLAKRIQKVEPTQLIFPTYFQFANNEQGELDTRCADLMQMTKHDIEFAQSNVLQRLNALIQVKSEEYGWSAVPEVTALFQRSGLCAKNSLIRSTFDSIRLQGDASGILHPVEEAHSQIADLIFSKLNFRNFIFN